MKQKFGAFQYVTEIEDSGSNTRFLAKDGGTHLSNHTPCYGLGRDFPICKPSTVIYFGKPSVARWQKKCYEFSMVDNIEDCEIRAVESLDDDDSSTISHFSRMRRLPKEGITIPGNQELLASNHIQSSSTLNDEIPTKREALMELKPLNRTLETSNGKSTELDGDEACLVKEMVPLESKDKNDKGGYKLNSPNSLELSSEGPNANTSDSRYAKFLSTGTAKMRFQMSKDSVDTHKVTTNDINKTEGMPMENIEMINIPKLEMRIRNLENIIAGKVLRLGKR
ncbi:hypothetical protein HAX54_024348 [Datura stramonium]|uniref:Uncharacterized protein n=1 Tax=Datura stramonium TaxID=4076 RepID=A0ABS8S5D6_DATST|nr:hypothetical protein [Datura stramonium]